MSVFTGSEVMGRSPSEGRPAPVIRRFSMGGNNFTPAAGEFILKRGVWQTLFTWAGWSPLAFLYWSVRIQEQFKVFPISWRRYGAGIPPYWQGEFSDGYEEFEVKPLVDFYIRVELRSNLADVGVNITHWTRGVILFDK